MHLEVGDQVTINIPDENWMWGYKPVPKQNGTLAEVIGFSESYKGRIGNSGQKPGVYVNNYWVKLKLEDGREHTEFDMRLDPVDKEAYAKRIERLREEGVPEEDKFLRDLPETKFWEGDYVLVYDTSGVTSISAPNISSEDFESIQEGEKPQNQLMVVGINWHWGKKGDSWTYSVSDNFDAGWNTYATEGNMELMARGNVWKYSHDESLSFGDLMEEASFFKMMGQVESVRNPANDLYKWTKDEVLGAIKEGTVDAFTLGIIPLTSIKSIDAMRFNDRDLGERVREKTLAGFNIE